jgi:hypothetical protein
VGKNHARKECRKDEEEKVSPDHYTVLSGQFLAPTASTAWERTLGIQNIRYKYSGDKRRVPMSGIESRRRGFAG